MYLLLLMAAWRSPDCALPDDDERLARMARVGLKKWRQVRQVMAGFWTITDGKWTQKRLLKERERSDAFRAHQSAAGQASAKKRFPEASTGKAMLPSPKAPSVMTNPLNRMDTGLTGVPTERVTEIKPPLPIPTPIEDSKKAIEVVKGALRARKGRTDFSRLENRQAYARQQIAKHVSWDVILAAEDPKAPNHVEAVKLVRAAAQKEEVAWQAPN